MIERKLFLLNELPEIEKAVKTLIQFGREHHLPDELVEDVRLALDEIITNIIKYGYEDAKRHQIEIRFVLKHDVLEVIVVDDARRFNPLEIPAPDIEKPLDERPVGGLGIYLVKKVMDNVAYKWTGKENLLTLKKKIGRQSDKAES